MDSNKLVIAIVAGFYYGAAKGRSQGFDDGKKAGLAEATENAKKEAAAEINPFGEAATPVNPFAEEANPLENVKTNPFE